MHGRSVAGIIQETSVDPWLSVRVCYRASPLSFEATTPVKLA